MTSFFGPPCISLDFAAAYHTVFTASIWVLPAMHKSIYNGRFRAELHAKKPRLATAHGSPLQLCNLLVARSNNVLYTVMHRDEQIWLVGLIEECNFSRDGRLSFTAWLLWHFRLYGLHFVCLTIGVRIVCLISVRRGFYCFFFQFSGVLTVRFAMIVGFICLIVVWAVLPEIEDTYMHWLLLSNLATIHVYTVFVEWLHVCVCPYAHACMYLCLLLVNVSLHFSVLWLLLQIKMYIVTADAI